MKKVIVIVGPTAIGKTKLSIELAKKLNTEIISGDSVQVYKKLDIGSAKVTLDEMDGVRHHLIDILEPGEPFSVADFQRIVRSKIDEISSKDKIPIIAGGTGLYVRSVLYDYRFLDEERDESFKEAYQDLSNEAVHALLQDADPKSAEQIHPNNRRRVLRALEMAQSDQKKSDLQMKREDELLYDAFIIGLNVERELLYERINSRVDDMIDMGLVNEVKALYEQGHTINAIGYKEFYDYFKGNRSIEESIETLKKDTRHLAKRQLTFFRNKFHVNWFTSNIDDFEQTIEEVYQSVKHWLKEY